MGSSVRRYSFINRSFITPVKHLLGIYTYTHIQPTVGERIKKYTSKVVKLILSRVEMCIGRNFDVVEKLATCLFFHAHLLIYRSGNLYAIPYRK